MCDIALHWCKVFLMSVIGVIEWAPVELGKRMGILGLVQAHRLARRGGGVSMHITRRRQNSFCNALAEREESFW